MTVLFEIAAVAGALACAAHMLWRMHRGRRGASTAERRRVLAERLQTFSRNGPTRDRH